MEKPLKNILVIDLTRVLAGPYCTMVLSDLGARVIKVENPRGDDSREIGPFIKKGKHQKSAYFWSLNRGKESIALNLKNKADRKVFEKLLECADVLVENFRPGTMKKLGYDWDMIRQKHPRLIYASVSGFGQTGPYREKAAYDMVVQAMGGIMSITGHEEGPPTRVGSSIGDIIAGLFTTIGITAALKERAETGRGRMVDVSMLDSQIAILENAIARYEATGDVPQPLGSRHPSITPFSAFKTKDGYIVVAAGNDALFRRLCKVLGIPEVAETSHFLSNNLRTENWNLLEPILTNALQNKTSEEWLSLLEQEGIPAGPINTVEEALKNPQILARNMVVESHDPLFGILRMAGNPIKMDTCEEEITRPPAPELDEHRDAILRELGLKP